MDDALLLIVGGVIGFIAAVVQRTYEARQLCYVKAVRLASQFISSEDFSVSGKPGKAPRPSSLEINQVFSELLIYCGRRSELPQNFMDFFCERDGNKVLNELWPELLRKIRRELWIMFTPSTPRTVHFRWEDDNQ